MSKSTNIQFKYTWHSKDDPPSEEYFLLEREIFADKFLICPATYPEFQQRFQKRYLLGSCLDKEKLCGFLFMTELIRASLYYVRALGLPPHVRSRGIGTCFLQGAVESLPDRHAVAFTSNSRSLIQLFYKFYSPFSEERYAEFRSILCKYNPRLAQRRPNMWIPDYYLTPEGRSLPGFFGLMERTKS